LRIAQLDRRIIFAENASLFVGGWRGSHQLIGRQGLAGDPIGMLGNEVMGFTCEKAEQLE